VGEIPLNPEHVARYGGYKIIGLEITGVRPQREYLVRAILDIQAGDYLNSVNFDRIEEALERTGLFDRYYFSYRTMGRGFILTLNLHEKLHRISLPLFSLSEQDIYTGGAFIRRSFLEIEELGDGYRTWHPASFTGFIRYINPRLAEGTQKLRILFEGKQETSEHRLAGGEVLRRFRGDRSSLESRWTLLYQSNFKPTMLLSYEVYDVRQGASSNIRSPESSERLSVGFELSYHDSYPLYYFDEGVAAQLQVANNYVPRSHQDYPSLHVRLDRSYELADLQRLLIALRGGFNPAPPALLGLLEGPGHYTLDRHGSTDRLYASSIGLFEFPVQELPWAYLTLSFFLEAGLYSPSPEYFQLHGGPGAAIHLYLKGMTQALGGFILSYDLINSSPVIGFFAGIKM